MGNFEGFALTKTFGGFYKFISCNFEWIVEQIAVRNEGA